MKRIGKFSLICFLLFILSSCGTSANNETDGTLKIYTTVYPLQYFTQEIGQSYVTVESIYPPGSDEHTYEPTQKEMMNIANSDLFIYIGLGLEGFVDKAKEALHGEKVQFFPAGEQLLIKESDTEYEHHADEDDHDHHHGDVDPHVWLDPLYAIDMATAIKNKLVELLPEEEVILEENYRLLVEKLQKLHHKFEQLANSADKKEFIVSHQAYGYWEKRYGFKQLSISGLSSASEPSQKELGQIVATAKQLGIKYIFFEQNTSSKTTEVIQKELQLEKLQLHNLSVLTEKDIKEGKNYFSIMEDNLQSLQLGLGS